MDEKQLKLGQLSKLNAMFSYQFALGETAKDVTVFKDIVPRHQGTKFYPKSHHTAAHGLLLTFIIRV